MTKKSPPLFKFFLGPFAMMESVLFRIFFVLAGPGLMFAYIVWAQPLGLSMFKNSEVITFATFYSIPVILIWVIHLFIIQGRIFKQFSLIKTIAWLVWINLVIGFYNYVFPEIYLFKSQFDWYFLPEVMSKSLAYGGVIFIIIFLVFMTKKYLLQAKA